jgi:hypothetical protein
MLEGKHSLEGPRDARRYRIYPTTIREEQE